MYQESSQNDINISFYEYYKNNGGILFKKYEIYINNTTSIFDVYWGDPNIIFNQFSNEPYPLAFIKFPKWKHEPNTRIYLHKNIEINNEVAFEFILAHEIGHFCLFDIFGINHPKGNIFLDVHDTEIWADYFAFLYFIKYRNINNLEQLKISLLEVDNLRNNIYNIIPNDEYSFANKTKYLELFLEKIKLFSNDDKNISLMLVTFEDILNQIGKLI